MDRGEMTGGLASNLALTTALMAFAMAQTLKVVTHRCGPASSALVWRVTRGQQTLTRQAPRRPLRQNKRREVGP